jgi:hypothetical protein
MTDLAETSVAYTADTHKVLRSAKPAVDRAKLDDPFGHRLSDVRNSLEFFFGRRIYINELPR